MDDRLNACLSLDPTQMCPCLAAECPKVYANDSEAKESCWMDHCFLSKRALDDTTLIEVTCLYAAIMAIGIAGNVMTLVVIRKHPLLKTHSSAYLLNLAVSDLVTLCVGLPFEIFTNWSQWPWPFPDFVCNLKGLIAETTSSVSILTILLFSIERYVAICHPFLFVKTRPIRDNVHYFLIATWIVSIACASPFGYYHTADYIMNSWPGDRQSVDPVESSKMCMVAIVFQPQLASTFKFLFHCSALFFFVVPLLVIFSLYALIACQMKSRSRSILLRSESTTEEGSLRITFILASIVCAFFFCYLPFQMQRLIFFYVDSGSLERLNQYLYFISGLLFYLATVINPILYNLVSARFRRASKEVILALFTPYNYKSKLSVSRISAKYSLSKTYSNTVNSRIEKNISIDLI